MCTTISDPPKIRLALNPVHDTSSGIITGFFLIDMLSFKR